MAKVTSEQFIELVGKSKLADEAQIATVVQSLRESHGGQLPEDPVEVSKAFEAAKLITRWHSEKLLQGKYRGFFLGKHKLLGHLGTGGMSTVYLAEHTIMHHRRAIKVMPRSKLGNNSYLRRFQQEAKAIAGLNHPNIVRAYDVDNENDTHYIVMEYVEGADIQDIVKKNGPLPYDKVAEYTAQAARGLQHAHDRGLIHRDVKPANMLVNRDDMVKVLDLGLALYADDEASSLTIEHNDKVLGTADYLAPEQAINSHQIDHRADIYSLGCSMYYMLTGRPPFPEGSIAQRIAKHQRVMPDDIRKFRPDCPGELDGICVKMMQKDPRFRYPDGQTVADTLQKWLDAYRASGHASTAPALNPQPSPTLRAASTGGMSSAKNLTGESSGRMGSVISLSASDSGVLRNIASASGSIIDSKVDLVHDTNAPNVHRRRSKTPEEIKKQQDETTKRINRVATAAARRQAAKPRATTDAHRGSQAGEQSTRAPMGGLAIALMAIMLLAGAMVLGFFIARWVG